MAGKRFPVAGDLYYRIDGKLVEIKRQLRQPGGYPFDPERLDHVLQDVIEGRFMKDVSSRASRKKKIVLSATPVVVPGAVIVLGDGFQFTVDKVLEFPVDYTLPVEIINQKMGLNMKNDWEYVSEPPARDKKKVKAVIGRLNRAWTEEQVVELLTKPGCPLKGSGAWVREGFILVRPRYDGKGWIGFPDSATSRWRRRRDSSVCFPRLWSAGVDWDRYLLRVRNEWLHVDRLCLLCG